MASLGEGTPSGCCSTSRGGISGSGNPGSGSRPQGPWSGPSLAATWRSCSFSRVKHYGLSQKQLPQAGVHPGASPHSGMGQPPIHWLRAGPETLQPGGDCSRGLALALKKPRKKVFPSAIRAALGFSLKHLKYLWGQVPEVFEVYFTWSINNKHEQEQ